MQLIDFDMDKLTRNFKEYLGFSEAELEFVQKEYSKKIEFEVKDNRLYLILPNYQGYDTSFFITYINENTFFFRKEYYEYYKVN